MMRNKGKGGDEWKILGDSADRFNVINFFPMQWLS